MQDASLVVIVEDEPITRAQLDAHFKDAGFETLCREDGEALEQIVAERSPDLVLLDIKLPGADGLTLTRALRAVSDVGIILVTSRHDQVDRIVGLESGADDYVTKPFDPRELLSRARNLQTRVQAQRQQLRSGHERRFDRYCLDLNRRDLTDEKGTKIHLSAGEFQLLLTFAEHAGEVMTRDFIMNRIRNREWYPDDRYIDVLVGQLRKKLGETASTARLITTIHGSGYLFTPEIT